MLESIRTFFKNLFANFGKPKGPSVLGIDISSSTIKVVQLRKKQERAVLETYGELALGPYAGVPEGKATALPTQTVAQALSDLMREAKVTTTNAGISIPMRSSLINVIEMPDLGEKRLKEMIPIEVRKYIPVNISEVMLDWRIIPRKGDTGAEEEPEAPEAAQGGQPVAKEGKFNKKVEVLVVAIHNDTIKRYQEIIQNTNIEPSFFEIEVFSTIRAVLDQGIQPTIIVDMGAANTKLFIVEGGILKRTHIINRGSQDITNTLSKALSIDPARAEDIKKKFGLTRGSEEEKAVEVMTLSVEGIFNEAQRVMLDFQQKHNVNIGKVILAGGGSMLKGLDAVAKNVFQAEVFIANPFGKVETPAFLEQTLQQIGPEFSVAIGAALRKLTEV